MGEFSKPKVTIDLDEYNKLLEDNNSPATRLLEQVAINLYKKEYTEYPAWQLPNFTELCKLAKKQGLKISITNSENKLSFNIIEEKENGD